MGVPILQLGCLVMCPHGGMATPINTNTKVLVGGAPALLATDTWTVAGCVFAMGPKPSPCVTVQWLTHALRVKVQQKPVLLQSSVGLCKSAEGLPQGPAAISMVQPRVGGM